MSWREHYRKAVTFSYDDGVTQDIRFVDMLNRYHLKGTFNLNSGIGYADQVWTDKGVEIHRCHREDMEKLYRGHEVAVHTLQHLNLYELKDKEQIAYEILEDRKNLEQIFHVPIVGMAYPFGGYQDSVIEILRENHFRYARTTRSSYSFEEQTDLLTYAPTCHHNDEHLMELAKKLVESRSEEMQIFCVWGHSYEFEVDGTWDMMEDFCRYISNRDDIYYGTNQEVLIR